ncbi:hypothetical protein L227DRAFT_613518 [Lentinus tigrinus ALCF2SS1-6]|uniref:Uncharacterized protein n=1 Tax=Lentinus tigrinus ALCF2SS1-6 TaxID=1328759 RepID=A0A5C2S3R6_9APHY|nr:hypothetical protein L227DRAFT_613518 [Lentinus tigrinus ALCF2SS1-6]
MPCSVPNLTVSHVDIALLFMSLTTVLQLHLSNTGNFSGKFNKSLSEKEQDIFKMQYALPHGPAPRDEQRAPRARLVVEQDRQPAVRHVKADELEAAWLTEGLLPESFVDGTILHTLAQSDLGKGGETWRMEQTWGSESVGGAKRYIRRVYLVGAKGEAI